MVTIHVGEERTKYVVHEQFICHYSDFFQSAFNSGFSETESKEVSYPDTTTPAFGLFIQWLYTQSLSDIEGSKPSVNDLIEVWFLADAILVPSLQNKALLAINEHRQKAAQFITQDFHRIYERTDKENLLRKFLIDQCAAALKEIANPQNFPHEMLVDLYAAAIRVRNISVDPTFSPSKMAKYFRSEEAPEKAAGRP